MFGLSGKERPHCVEFTHDGPESEDVDWCVVVWGSQQNLRSPIPSGGNVVGKGRLAVALLGEAEVGNFDCLIVAQQILWLQIPMKEVLLVHVSKALQSLK